MTPPVRGDLDDLYRREYRSVVALAYGLSGSRSGAEELAQEAFLEAHRAWDRISTYDDPARLGATGRGEPQRVAGAPAGGRGAGPDPRHGEAGAPRRAARLRRRVLAGRPPAARRQAQAVALHYLDDLSVADVAAVLEISPDTVKVHLHRGRRALADALGLTPIDDEEAR